MEIYLFYNTSQLQSFSKLIVLRVFVSENQQVEVSSLMKDEFRKDLTTDNCYYLMTA